jgi:hypothetical protein
MRLDRGGDRLDLARTEQGRRPRRTDAVAQLLRDIEADRPGQARRLLEPRIGVAAPRPPQLRQGDDGAGAAGEVVLVGSLEDAQAPGSSSSASMKLTGCSGCTVETACL